MSTQEKHFGNSFRGNLAEMMRARGLGQKAVGDAIGVSQATVFKWLYGTLPRSGELYRLAKFFGVSMEQMLGETPQKEASEHELDSVKPTDLQADRLGAFLRDAGWTMDQFERVLDGFRELGGAAFGSQAVAPKHAKSHSVVDSDVKTRHQCAAMTRLETVLRDVERAIESGAGTRAELMQALGGVSRQQLNDWLSRRFKPSGEVALVLLDWAASKNPKEKNRDAAITASRRAQQPNPNDEERKRPSGRKRRKQK